MVRGALPVQKALRPWLLGVMMMSAGCSSNSDSLGPDLSAYRSELEKTDDILPMEAGSRTEQEALERFKAFYAVYSAEAIRSGIRDVYAGDAWFGDPYHTVKGIDEIEHYFLAMAEPVESCTFSIGSINRAGKEYYIHWTMNLVSKAAGDRPVEAIGVSHVRFNAEGKVVFQQDYWDTSAMLDRLPVVGFWTRLVKGRIMKGVSQ